jgi:hypothetical protein
LENRFANDREGLKEGSKLMPVSGEAVMENVRRFRAIASLYRQTATFRPVQSWSLLGQAERWEQLALAELEAYFRACNCPNYDDEPQVTSDADARWEMMAAA